MRDLEDAKILLNKVRTRRRRYQLRYKNQYEAALNLMAKSLLGGQSILSDILQKLGKSLIQHGSNSNRVYLMKLSRDDFPQIIERLDELAQKKHYTKLLAKVPQGAEDAFKAAGYKKEACVPRFYEGKEAAVFMAKFLDPAREAAKDQTLIHEIINFTKELKSADKQEKGEDYNCNILTPEAVGDMVDVYKIVFKTYPFPIHSREYLLKTMRENIVYFGVRDNGKLVAVASCEIDVAARNVEMTDFATLPEYRGRGLASSLLVRMEEEMKKQGLITAYTIARAVSYGMNITFARRGYLYAGTLINNTDISGGIESMNIWYKGL